MKKNIFNIDIDFAELNDRIEEFSIVENVDPYLVMSKDTAKVIANQCCEFAVDTSSMKETGRLGKYKGYKILIDNDLSVGDVDVR